MYYPSIDDFISNHEVAQLDICKKCKSKVELVIEGYAANIGVYEINAHSLPQLKCIQCESKYLSLKSSLLVKYFFDELLKSGKQRVTINPKKFEKRYEFCQEIEFIYDHRDYDNIPRLAVGNDGFLTPVYFKKAVLIYFMHHPEYGLNLFSETYGNIEGDGFVVSFGINKNDKVVFWLGDLDTFDKNTLLALKANNILSDHTLVESEFYDAQLNVLFSEPIIERRIINLRNKFYDNFQASYGLSLHHLETEVLESINEIQKPITYSSLEVKPVISALHKILIEAVSLSKLKQHYEATVNDKDRNYTSWKSIKYFESHLLNIIVDKDLLKETIAPLYILNDLRIIYFHLLPDAKIHELKRNAACSLGISSFENTKDLYETFMEELENLFIILIKG